MHSDGGQVLPGEHPEESGGEWGGNSSSPITLVSPAVGGRHLLSFQGLGNHV